MAIDFSQLEGQCPAKKSFCYSSLFKKRSLIEKNLDNAFLKTLNLFFSSCFSKGPYTKTFTFSSIVLTTIFIGVFIA